MATHHALQLFFLSYLANEATLQPFIFLNSFKAHPLSSLLNFPPFLLILAVEELLSLLLSRITVLASIIVITAKVAVQLFTTTVLFIKSLIIVITIVITVIRVTVIAAMAIAVAVPIFMEIAVIRFK